MRRSEEETVIPFTNMETGHGHAVRTDIFYYTNQIVNLVFIGKPGIEGWVLIDTGMPKSTNEIIKVAEDRFGKGVNPSAILLTHGHFDHVSNAGKLAEKWRVPVYVHPLEIPFICGQDRYPESDNSDERLLSRIASIYPHERIDLGDFVKSLPADGSVPYLKDWKWIHTPGHTAGHVSFFRESDKTLVAGDAFVTVRDDSFQALLNQYPEVCSTPVFHEGDRKIAMESVKKILMLQPSLAITGHGIAMEGEALLNGLKLLEQSEDLAAHAHSESRISGPS
jgi:glyoxylase-like metal-dependent hydrolase (beta-lactamase superfamily II)